MKLVFAGTPAVAVPALEALVAGGHELQAVITRRDAQTGRKRTLTATAVAQAAEQHRLTQIKANRLDAEVTDRIAELKPELGVVVAYGGLVREPLLSLPRLGWINLHFSLLPRWRGAAPVQHAILAGERVTGASVFQLVPELDAGDVFGESQREIGANETAGEVLDALSERGSELLIDVVEQLAHEAAVAVPQSGEVTLAPKLTIEDAHLDFSERADAVYNRFRATTPEPGAFALVNGARFKILRAEPGPAVPDLDAGAFQADDEGVLVGTATDPIRLLTVQPAGKLPMSAMDWWRGQSNRESPVAL